MHRVVPRAARRSWHCACSFNSCDATHFVRPMSSDPGVSSRGGSFALWYEYFFCLVVGCRRTRYQQWFQTFRPVTSAESLVLRQVMPRYGLSRERCPKTSQKYAERQRERERDKCLRRSWSATVSHVTQTLCLHEI